MNYLNNVTKYNVIFDCLKYFFYWQILLQLQIIEIIKIDQ